MKLIKKISFLLFIIAASVSFAQSAATEIKITGKVTNFNDQPIKNAIIYVDSVRTEVMTNRRGYYKIKLSSKAQHIGASVDEYGLLSTNFTGERRIDFVFRNPEDNTLSKDMKIGVAYKRDLRKINNNKLRGQKYEDFPSMALLFRSRFPFVTASGGGIAIGRGPNSFGGDPTPLILIENQRSNPNALFALSPVDIQDIQVIRRGSEAAQYGSLAASNGVIIVKLKGGKDS